MVESRRRTFLKAGMLGALVLAVGGGIYRATRNAAPAGFALDGEARDALSAIIPVMLDGALPADTAARAQAVAQVTQGMHAAILGLPLSAQKEVQDLFGLLALAPTRRLLAGVGPWRQASSAEVAAFLQSWRTSRLGLLRAAYAGLHDLAMGSWYASPASWGAIGYPGPVQLT